MGYRMLIDAADETITRVAVTDNSGLVQEFDQELKHSQTLRGNVYLATITRVEPSLQAAFVDYGGDRHGFLSFNEIHPDYFYIPIEDRKKLVAEMQQSGGPNNNNGDEDDDDEGPDNDYQLGTATSNAMLLPRRHRYRIQEVIRSGQVVLAQVARDERGNKGAALTTFLSLAGRYCVLMPNNNRAGGVSRKISSPEDRRRLKSILDDLVLPPTMSLIIRTAGSSRTPVEIRRDYEFLAKAWNSIRENTMASHAPSLIYEEGDLVIRALRDMYDRHVEEVVINGTDALKNARNFMRNMIPSHVNRIVQHDDEAGPLFQISGVEEQISNLFVPEIKLPSGGYIVIHQTEALVSIDVNSGRATRERDIEKTALNTNLEAADEVGRQLRLRDLAGLIVIDFIDMRENRNIRLVEKRIRESVKTDRARVQIRNMSQFGMLEMSRQRLRGNIQSAITQPCDICGGTGIRLHPDWLSMNLSRAVDGIMSDARVSAIKIIVSADLADNLLNQNRQTIVKLEKDFGSRAQVGFSHALRPGTFEIYVTDQTITEDDAEFDWKKVSSSDDLDAAFSTRGRGGNRRRERSNNGARRSDQDSPRRAQRASSNGSRDSRNASRDSRSSSSKSTDSAALDGEAAPRGGRGLRRNRKGVRPSERPIAASEREDSTLDKRSDERPKQTRSRKGRAKPDDSEKDTPRYDAVETKTPKVNLQSEMDGLIDAYEDKRAASAFNDVLSGGFQVDAGTPGNVAKSFEVAVKEVTPSKKAPAAEKPKVAGKSKATEKSSASKKPSSTKAAAKDADAGAEGEVKKIRRKRRTIAQIKADELKEAGIKPPAGGTVPEISAESLLSKLESGAPKKPARRRPPAKSSTTKEGESEPVDRNAGWWRRDT